MRKYSMVQAKVAISCILIASAFSRPAVASDRSLQTIWMIQKDNSYLGEHTLAREDYVLKQRLLPSGLAAIGSDSNEAGLSAGSQLVEINTPGAKVFCDPVLRSQKLIGHAQICLVDSDDDGNFEGMFLTTSVTSGILTVEGARPKKPKQIHPVSYRRLDPAKFELNLFVGVQYRGHANPYGNHVFQINYGSNESTSSLTDRFVVGKALLPAKRTPLGADFDLLAQTSDGLSVRVYRTMPSQPFGVTKVTTWRFY